MIELKFSFNSKLAFIGYALGIFINLIVYFFTSKALIPNPESGKNLFQYGYFEYIVIGEVVLLLTQASLSQGQDLVIRLKNNGILEQVYFSKLGILKGLSLYYFALVIINSIHIIFSLLISKVFFNISLTPLALIKFIILICVVSILFMGVYFVNVFTTLLLKRRNNSLQHLVNLMGFFSGAYFPLEVIGSEKASKVLNASPLTALVSWTRSVIYDNIWLSSNFYVLLFWFLVPMAFGILFFVFFVKKKQGYFYVNQ